jgi:dTDP-4-amino-4,6-dideoxygalactose transaminase
MDAVLTCLVEEKVGPGACLNRLGSAACDFFGAEGAAGLRSPSLALGYALRALGLPPESGVALSALAPSWHYTAVRSWGYTPVVLDVDGETALVTLDSLDGALKRGARVILLAEPLGLLPDMDGVLALETPVIEDVSQSAGSLYRERRAGSFGVFSILGLEGRDAVTAGGGALLLAPRKRDAAVLKKHVEEAEPIDLLPDLNSALALTQLKEFAKNEERRKKIAGEFNAALLQGRHRAFPVTDGVEPGIYGFPVPLGSGFKDVKQYAARKGIEVDQAFAGSIVARFPDETVPCVNARSLFLRTALFPLYPRLTNSAAVSIRKALGTLP